MSAKLTCPGCNSHTSDVLGAVRAGMPCPSCGLSASAITEVLTARERGANEELTAKYEAVVIRAGRAETEVRALRAKLEDLRELIARDISEFYDTNRYEREFGEEVR